MLFSGLLDIMLKPPTDIKEVYMLAGKTKYTSVNQEWSEVCRGFTETATTMGREATRRRSVVVTSIPTISERKEEEIHVSHPVFWVDTRICFWTTPVSIPA